MVHGDNHLCWQRRRPALNRSREITVVLAQSGGFSWGCTVTPSPVLGAPHWGCSRRSPQSEPRPANTPSRPRRLSRSRVPRLCRGLARPVGTRSYSRPVTALETSDLGLQLPPLHAAAPVRNSTTFLDNMAQPVHRWFRYSAGFSAGWVESVIAGTSDARVLDPFAGSGTTLLASQTARAESYGVESQTFVARVARAKLNWTADAREFLAAGEAVLRRAEPVTIENAPPLLEKCFTPESLGQLMGLRRAIESKDEDSAVSSLLWLAFVAIIRKTSHVGTAQWQYVLPNKSKRGVLGVSEAFELQLRLMATDMLDRQAALGAAPLARLLEADARTDDLAPAGWATHVICSPPYANNYDYADATRLEQTVLGEVAGWADLKKMRGKLVRSCSQAMTGYKAEDALADSILAPIVDELSTVYKELNAVKATHGGKKNYDAMIVAYFHDLAYVWRQLRKATVEGAKVCYVVGDSAPYGVYVPVERWLAELALAEGFTSWSFEKVRDRNVKWKNRKHDVPLHEGRLWVEG